MKSLVLALVLTLSVFSAASAAPAREAQLEDLAIARSSYVMKSRAFTPTAREAALARISALESRAGTLSEAQFALSIMQIVALADNAHDTAHFMSGWKPALRAPVRFLWLQDGIVVSHTAAGEQDLLGARVLAVEGRSPRQLLTKLRGLSGGTDGFRRWNLSWLLTQSDMLHAAGLAAAPDRLRIVALTASGRRIERTLRFTHVSEAPPGMTIHQQWSGQATPAAMAKGWRGARDGLATPLYLADPGQTFRLLDLPQWDALYVQMRSNLDAERQVAAFVAEVEARLARSAPQNLIVDLRFNTGGDADLTRAMWRRLADTTRGQIFVLLGPHTFSAGIVGAAALKHDSRSSLKMVGEPVGDRPRFWSEAEHSCLPNSGLCLSASVGLWDLTKGCTGEPGCYGDKLDATAGDLSPNTPVRTRVVDWLAGRDPVLEVVERRLQRTGFTSGHP